LISYPLLAGYCVLIALAALSGGWTALTVRLTHQRLQLTTSIIGGFMVGVALLHLLPHALMSTTSGAAVHWMLGGMLVMFLLERFLHFHHHEIAEVEHDPDAGHDDDCEPQHHHHHHDHFAHHDHVHVHEHKLSWGGALVGLVIHSLVGGAALAAAMVAEGGVRFAGLAVFLITFLHKPLDSMTLLTLMRVAGSKPGARHAVNFAYALVTPIGAAIFLVGLRGVDVEHSAAVGAALAFAAGVFLTIALSDLLPELQFHAHDKIKLTAALLLGVALAWGVSVFEGMAHDHDHGHGHVDTGLSHDAHHDHPH